MKRIFSIISCFLIVSAPIVGQSRLSENVDYDVSLNGAASTNDVAPFWFSAGRYGVGSTEQYSGYLRASVIRPSDADSLRRWRVGYGLDVIGAAGSATCFNVQQAFLEFQYENARLSFGSKERSMELKNDELSSGGMTFSQNAVPIPQVRFELPRWWNISGKSRMVFIKGHLAYGMLTDGWWQEDHNAGTQQIYSKRSLYHSKAGYMKIGNEERFPLTATLGLEMVCQFGGTAYNLQGRGGTGVTFDKATKLKQGPKAFLDAFIPGGSDVNDGAYDNVGGNQLGSWNLSLGWTDTRWSIRAYLDHFFEDHSQMFWQYAWKDNLLGIEATFPENPVVSTALFEYLGTMDQSGPIYHDKTEALSTGLYGKDNYYGHHIYGAYQHWGQVQGNPLILSPIYNSAGILWPSDNRLRAYHAGLSGDPCSDIHWRVKFTHLRSLGTYDNPAPTPRHATYFLAEIGYRPHRIPGWGFTLSLGTNAGQLIGTSQGAMLTVSKFGVFNKRVQQ